jgi:hypothetical protein
MGMSLRLCWKHVKLIHAGMALAAPARLIGERAFPLLYRKEESVHVAYKRTTLESIVVSAEWGVPLQGDPPPVNILLTTPLRS